MRQIRCAEIWGGIDDLDRDVCTSAIDASVFSSSASGGRGGDIYYFSVCAADQLTRVVVADVMGHGRQVSHTSQWVYDSLKARMDDADGNRILSDVNRLADEYGYTALTTAVVLGFLSSRGALFFSCAGHHPVYLRRRASGEWTSLDNRTGGGAANLPLGVSSETEYTQLCEPVDDGDRLFLYTDGVLETPGAGGEEFGERRLMQVLSRYGNAPLAEMKSGVLDALRSHRAGALDHDDVTMLAIEIRPRV